jgi:WD40 repeat protein
MDGARIWEAYSGKLISSLSHPGAVSAAYSAKGDRVITASVDGTARVWSLDPIKTIAVLQGHTGFVASAQFNRAGDRVITAGQDGTARISNAINGDVVAVLNCGSATVWSAIFSPDGLRAVTAGNVARVWDLETNQVIIEFNPNSSITSVGFSPDGTRIVTASPDKMARIWDATSGRLLLTLNGHADEVWGAVFSSDGRRVITASNDRTARIWDSMTGAAIAVLIGHSAAVFKAALSPGDNLAVTGSWDRTARIWKIYRNTQDLADDAKRLTPRCLTSAERRRWFLDPEPPSWCIEKEKWPYGTQKWRDWLVSKRAGLAAPLPDISE